MRAACICSACYIAACQDSVKASWRPPGEATLNPVFFLFFVFFINGNQRTKCLQIEFSAYNEAFEPLSIILLFPQFPPHPQQIPTWHLGIKDDEAGNTKPAPHCWGPGGPGLSSAAPTCGQIPSKMPQCLHCGPRGRPGSQSGTQFCMAPAVEGPSSLAPRLHTAHGEQARSEAAQEGLIQEDATLAAPIRRRWWPSCGYVVSGWECGLNASSSNNKAQE